MIYNQPHPGIYLDKVYENLFISASGVIYLLLRRCSTSCFAKNGAKEEPLVPIPFKIPRAGCNGCKPTKGLLSSVAGRREAK
jgi:hypothetical protein